MKMTLDKFNSLISLARYFSSEKRCRDFITEQRWGKNVVCPFCNGRQIYRCKNGDNQFKCASCNKRFSCLVGTIFHKTKIPLQKWFMAIYLISSHKKGISSHQLSRDLNITQKTAWYMLHKVRMSFCQNDIPLLSGDVEIDEMYFGGRDSNKHEMKKVQEAYRAVRKPPIFGMVQRFGNARALVVNDTRSSTLLPIIMQYCAVNTVIFTDELKSYQPLSRRGFRHHVIRHGQKEYSRKGVTTNTIEGFWGHFKRMVFGTYHSVSKEYLQSYIDEAVYKYNTRKMGSGERFTIMFGKFMETVSYNDVKARRHS